MSNYRLPKKDMSKLKINPKKKAEPKKTEKKAAKKKESFFNKTDESTEE